jgi:outer membrane protein OmpA-like peptidoglycan-associated protein
LRQHQPAPGAQSESLALQDAAGNQATAQLLGAAAGVPEPVVRRTPQAIRATVYFAHNSATLQATQHAAVQQLSRELSGLEGPTVAVDGHASTEGSSGHNEALSRRRRTAVTALLGSGLRKVVDFDGEALGESQPAVAETAEEKGALERQRALNRRVEIVIVAQGGTAKGKDSVPETWSTGPEPEPHALPGLSKSGLGSEEQRLVSGPQPLPLPIQRAAEEAGAPKGVNLDGLAVWLEKRSPANHIAKFAAKAGPLVGQEPKELEKKLREAARSGIEAGLKEGLRLLVESIAGPPTGRPPLETGPGGVTELPLTPDLETPPIPFDTPPPRPQPAGLTLTDRVGANMTKLNYRPGEFITVNVTTVGWLFHGRATVEIAAEDGKQTFAYNTIESNRRNVQVSLAVPEKPGRYQLRLRHRDEVRDAKWFTVHGK